MATVLHKIHYFIALLQFPLALLLHTGLKNNAEFLCVDYLENVRMGGLEALADPVGVIWILPPPPNALKVSFDVPLPTLNRLGLLPPVQQN